MPHARTSHPIVTGDHSQRIAITGASQGIGRSLALEAVKRGAKVLAAARTREALESLKTECAGLKSPGQLAIVVCDITTHAGRQAIVDGVMSHYAGLDTLINNAGIGATGHLMESQPETLRQIFETNYFATVELTRLMIPLLGQNSTSAVVMISSVLGKRAWPARSLYSASKFALQAFSDALRTELAPQKIDVLVVSPGLTQTNFSKNMLERSARIPLDHLRGTTSESVAIATLNALERGDLDTVLTPRGKLLNVVSHVAPWVIDFFGKRKIRKLFADEILARQAQ